MAHTQLHLLRCYLFLFVFVLWHDSNKRRCRIHRTVWTSCHISCHMRPKHRFTYIQTCHYLFVLVCLSLSLSLSGCILGAGYRPVGGLHPHVAGLHLPCAPVLRRGRQACCVEICPLPLLLRLAVFHHPGCAGCRQPGHRGAQAWAGEVTDLFCNLNFIPQNIDG